MTKEFSESSLGEHTNAENQGTGTNWYDWLFAKKKEEHLKNLRIARKHKKKYSCKPWR
jgi:hypothetical protein